MSTVLFVCGHFPDIRCARAAIAYRAQGWRVEVLCRRYPVQFTHVYHRVIFSPYLTPSDYEREIAESRADVVHVHGELLDYWPVMCAKEAGKPVILDAHDLQVARGPEAIFDASESEAFAAADAHVFVTERQRAYAVEAGYAHKPYAIVPNYPTDTCFIKRSIYPHIGGLVYAGHINARGVSINDRDLSPIADAMGGNLYVLPGNTGADYGIVMQPEHDYPLYINRLARHDWGFAGFPAKVPSWEQSFPTKLGEYLAAGIPFVAMNVPEAVPLAKMGLGIIAHDPKALPGLLRRADHKAFRRNVLKHRGKFTIESIATRYTDLAEAVSC